MKTKAQETKYVQGKAPEEGAGSRKGEETGRERSQRQRSGGGGEMEDYSPNLSSNKSVATHDRSL